MSVQFLDVVLLVENSGHVVVFKLVVRRFPGYVIAVSQIQREIDHPLLAIEVLFLLRQFSQFSILTWLAKLRTPWRGKTHTHVRARA